MMENQHNNNVDSFLFHFDNNNNNLLLYKRLLGYQLEFAALCCCYYYTTRSNLVLIDRFHPPQCFGWWWNCPSNDSIDALTLNVSSLPLGPLRVLLSVRAYIHHIKHFVLILGARSNVFSLCYLLWHLSTIWGQAVQLDCLCFCSISNVILENPHFCPSRQTE